MSKALDVNLAQSYLAGEVSESWDRWKRSRAVWEEERRELRNYLFATDTRTTSTSKLSWNNSTTMPKLTQIRDNLHANYMAALFPNSAWLKWEGEDKESVVLKKARAIEFYMRNKLEQDRFRSTVSTLVYDYIDNGNVFAEPIWVKEQKVNESTGEIIPGYIGPRARRISPYDHVYDISAENYRASPKITRRLVSLGEMHKLKSNPEYDQAVLSEALWTRNTISQYGTEDVGKDEAYKLDGFNSLFQYYTSGYVELLDFEGDLYDVDADVFYTDRIITVIDRRIIVRNIQNPSWFLNNTKFHCGWRLRPDNLMAMGPLDNLVGMQYRMDHIENAKADAVDQYIHPPKVIKGDVEDFDDVPDERIYVGDDGDVQFLRPPLDQILAYNNELSFYQLQMEEMAGAPKQAMGIRTPGEKTAYEVQTLENAAGRIFQNKITYFEEEFLEPLLNAMLELSVRNMSGTDVVRTMDDDLGVVEFMTITKEDITAKGKLRPRGARHFAAKAKLAQELTAFANSPIGQDPAVQVHISGKKIAKLFEDILEIEQFGLVQDNIRIAEQAETQKLVNAAQQSVEVDAETPTE